MMLTRFPGLPEYVQRIVWVVPATQTVPWVGFVIVISGVLAGEPAKLPRYLACSEADAPRPKSLRCDVNAAASDECERGARVSSIRARDPSAFANFESELTRCFRRATMSRWGNDWLGSGSGLLSRSR